MRKPLTALRAPITLPDDSPVSGLWGAIWLNTALAFVLKAVVHWNVLRLLAYGFLEVTLGLVLRAVAGRPRLHQEIEALRRSHRYCPPRPRGQKDDVTVRAQTRWLWPRARREGSSCPMSLSRRLSPDRNGLRRSAAKRSLPNFTRSLVFSAPLYVRLVGDG